MFKYLAGALLFVLCWWAGWALAALLHPTPPVPYVVTNGSDLYYYEMPGPAGFAFCVGSGLEVVTCFKKGANLSGRVYDVIVQPAITAQEEET